MSSSTRRPNFGRRGVVKKRQAHDSYILDLPLNNANIFSEVVRTYGHACFHHKQMDKVRAMLYAQIYENESDNSETCVASVVADAVEFASAVSSSKPDIAIEVLFTAAHLCEKNQVNRPDLMVQLITCHAGIFNAQMDFFRSRGWLMRVEERLWIHRYSLARFYTFLNVILPEIAYENGVDNLYPYKYTDDDDDDLLIVPFLSNYSQTNVHLQALIFFLTTTKVELEFRLSRGTGLPRSSTPYDFSWLAHRRRDLIPSAMDDYEDHDDNVHDFEDYYSLPPAPGTYRAMPRDLEYRWRIVIIPRDGKTGASAPEDGSLSSWVPPEARIPEGNTGQSMLLRLLVGGQRELLGKCKFVDYPIKTPLTYTTALGLACQASNPEAVLGLLQHGATPYFNSRRLRYNALFQCLEEPIGITIRILNRGRSWRDCTSDRISHETLTKLIGWEELEESRTLRVLELLLRAVRYAPIKFYNDEENPLMFANSASKDQTTGLMSFRLHERYKSYIPEDLISGAAPLCHLCRLTIRNALSDSWNLGESGIMQLPLPRIVKDYLLLLS